MAATRVLIVDDDLNIQRVLVFTLKQEGFEVLVASDGATGVAMATEQKPDLILMDVVMPGIDGYAAVQQIRAAEAAGQHVPIIMLAAESDVGQRVRGLRAGADDDIVKPFHPLELMARIRALVSRATSGGARAGAAPALGRVCAFYGAKGGAGTTTLALNAAIALARELKRRTLLMDANLQFGDLRVFLDLGLDTSSLVEAMDETDLDADLLKRLTVAHKSGVDLLLAPPNPAAGDIVVERHRTDPEQLGRVLATARQQYDYTLVDMATSIDDFDLALFDAADVIFVVMTADLSCIKNVRLVLETMQHLGYARSKVQLILNRSTAATGINVKAIEQALERPIDHQVINEYRAAISALNSGEPFMLTRPDGTLGRSVAAFAKAIDAVAVAEATAELEAQSQRR